MGSITINSSNNIKMPQEQKAIDWNLYYKSVISDYNEMKAQYPMAYLTIPPTVKPELATIRVVAANKDLIESVGGVEEDFLGDFSRELYLVMPIEYRKIGCNVYGANWVDIRQFQNHDIHFFYDDGKLIRTKNGLHLCVGTPESFILMKNVILENVRTAENMLIAYERVLVGASKSLDIIAYSHGDKGRKEFHRSRCKYIP